MTLYSSSYLGSYANYLEATITNTKVQCLLSCSALVNAIELENKDKIKLNGTAKLLANNRISFWLEKTNRIEVQYYVK